MVRLKRNIIDYTLKIYTILFKITITTLRLYFENLYYLVQNYHNYSVLGHLDLLKRYDEKDGYNPFVENKEIITKILKYIIADGKGIELNTSSIKGHLDLLKRYDEKDGYNPFVENKEIITKILKYIIADGKGIELNTSSIKYKLDDLMPSRDILKLY